MTHNREVRISIKNLFEKIGQFGVPEVLEGVFALIAKRLYDMVQNWEGFIDIATLFNYLTGIIALFFWSRQINKKHFGLFFNLIVVFFC